MRILPTLPPPTLLISSDSILQLPVPPHQIPLLVCWTKHSTLLWAAKENCRKCHHGATLHPISTNHQFSASVRKTGTKSKSENTIASQTSLYYRCSTRIMVPYKKLGLMSANRQMMFGFLLTHRYNILKMNSESSWAMFVSTWTYMNNENFDEQCLSYQFILNGAQHTMLAT